MKKKKVIILAIILVIIILAIIAVSKFMTKNKKEETKLLDIYDNLISSESYMVTIEQDENNKTIMAKKRGKTVIDQYSGESRSTTLVKDGNTYLVLHDREEYYVYERNNVEQSILTDGLKELIDKTYTVGNEKVKGKNYDYEEYEGSTVFMISNTSSLNDEGVKTRLYFNKKSELVYVKTIYSEGSELLKINISNEVDDALFEIPSNYAEGN